MIPCLGGWCTQRDRCAHYYAESDNLPAERLCGPAEEPVFFHQVFEVIEETVH